MQWQKRSRLKSAALQAVFVIFFLHLMLACGDEQKTGELSPSPPKPESFTFFDIGVNTQLTGAVRKDLGDKLGRDAIEKRNIIDLEMNYRGFLKKYFPELFELNQQLNYPPGQRVDHDTVKLMYRYAQRKNIPFDYAELIFSNYTQLPLLIRVRFKRDEAGVIKTLEEKYGPPQIIEWQEAGGTSMFWTKKRDFLILSKVPDQFGNPEYQVAIYFVANLEELLAVEAKAREESEKQKTKTGRKAF
jgi:hypothetical protein